MQQIIRFTIIIFLAFQSLGLWAQPATQIEKQEMLKKHVYALADDSMEGRATGTPGEDKAAAYIADYFQNLGLTPMGLNGTFFQDFKAFAGKNYGAGNALLVKKQSYSLNEDYYPLEYSSNGKIKACLVDVGHGIVSPETGRDDYSGKTKLKGKIFVMETTSPEADNPHSELARFTDLRHKIDLAVKKGAAGIILVNSAADEADPFPDFSKKLQDSGVPVVFFREAIRLKNQAGEKATIVVNMTDDYRNGKNVIALQDNGADQFIIIGGHYDHLGYGEFGSRYMGSDKQIHNGADDNASGVAVVLELARRFKEKPQTAYNILYMAFSGEEMGLLGSRYFADNPTIVLEKVSFMINLDMVGRMVNKTLVVNGTGSSPDWGNLLVEATPKSWALNLATNESGIGPSDHTSFYLKNIPVLAMFTGTHDDYHHPEDDADKVNFYGMELVRDLVYSIVEASVDKGKLSFTKTKESEEDQGRRRFNVTLGVLPSYSFQGEGLKIDGVSDGKAAQIAGLKAGDIIVKMGEIEVGDIYAYMDALAKFRKGDVAMIKVKRGEEIMEFEVKF